MRLFQVVNLAKDYLVLGVMGLVFIGVVYLIFFRKILKNHIEFDIKRVVVFCMLFCYVVVVIGATIFVRPGVYEHANLHLFSSYIEAWNNYSKAYWRNIILNILMFVPLGFLLPIFNDRFKKFYEHLVNNYTFDNSNWYVLEALKKGVGLYISPIPRYIKREILNLFNDGFLKVLVVTTAFAEGVNSSAKNIIITNEIAGANKKMTNLDMLNLSGRAGRFGKYSKGYIYAVKNTISERLKEAEKNGVTITNSNYEFPKNDKLRSDYEIDIIDIARNK